MIMIRRIIRKELDKYYHHTDMIEFEKISQNIKKYCHKNDQCLLLDVGSGLCDFINYIKKNHNHLIVKCIDINEDMVALAKDYGFDAKVASILKIPYDDDSFDIVHCSHVIEHLSYPDVVVALDELFRVVKDNGIVIIRSPLVMNHRFFNDIDHVRPYPPNAILNYYNNPQQQKVGKFKVKEVDRWYTKIAFEINYYVWDNYFTRMMNIVFKLSWNYLRFPFDRPNNYGIVLKIEK